MRDMQFNGTPEEWDALVKKNRESTVKIYTEEQVREAIKLADKLCFLLDFEEEGIMSLLKPIELPTDEEIREKSIGYFDYHSYQAFFSDGAKWMRDKILNK